MRLVAALFLAGCAKKDAKKFLIATDTTFAPFEFQDASGNFVGMANFAGVLKSEGLISGTPYANVLLGNIAGAQSRPLDLAATLAGVPDGTVVSLAGIGRFQLQANLLGLIYADGVRVGLEDNLWYDTGRRQPASNRSLVERILRLAGEMERPPASAGEVRRRLGLSLP